MTHLMNLLPSAFQKMADGHKTVELRLNDEKRKRIRVSDTVIFSCIGNSDLISAKVKALHPFADFQALYAHLPLEQCGYSGDSLSTASYTDMEQFYTREQIEKYGALGIELSDVQAIRDVRENLTDPILLELLTPGVYDPTAKKDQSDDKTQIYAHSEGGRYDGIIVFEINERTATVLDLAVAPDRQRRGIGSQLIDFLFHRFEADKVIAKADGDSVGFYRKYGFTVRETYEKFGTNRYVCVCDRTSRPGFTTP